MRPDCRSSPFGALAWQLGMTAGPSADFTKPGVAAAPRPRGGGGNGSLVREEPPPPKRWRKEAVVTKNPKADFEPPPPQRNPLSRSGNVNPHQSGGGRRLIFCAVLAPRVLYMRGGKEERAGGGLSHRRMKGGTRTR